MNNPTEREKLKPCPFCGADAKLCVADYVTDDMEPMPIVECSGCSAWVKPHDWQARAALEQDCGEVEVVAWSDGEINAFISDECKRYGDKLGGATGRATNAHQTPLITLASHKAKLAAVEAERDSLRSELSACTEHPGGCGYWKEAAKQRETERDRYAVLLGNSERENLDLSGQLSAVVIRAGDLSKKALAVMDAGDTLVAERDALKEVLVEVKADLFLQIESKHGPKAAREYPSITLADKLLASKGD